MIQESYYTTIIIIITFSYVRYTTAIFKIFSNLAEKCFYTLKQTNLTIVQCATNLYFESKQINKLLGQCNLESYISEFPATNQWV